MEIFYLAVAFFCGLLVKSIHLPPLVGYLAAGFILSAFGTNNHDNELLKLLADFGITLMLFTIGLKLKVKDLWKKEVIFVGSAHMLITVILLTFIILLIAFLLPHFGAIEHKEAVLISFIISFSSTICALKILQESNTIDSRYGKITISILVLQDIFAVLFLVFSSGISPTIWALGLPALIFLKPLLNRLLNAVGHGELLFVMGILLAFTGYYIFDLVNIKGDFGALIIGMLISSHAKNNEMVKALVNLKDMLLIAFFLSIGLIGLPDINSALLALLFTLFIPVKYTLFYALLALCKVRSRASYLSATLLSNYGEFGLIVTYFGVSLGMLSESWLTIMGLSIALSFMCTSICYSQAHGWYYSLRPWLKKYQRKDVIPEDICHYPKDINILIIGAGRVGSSALERLNQLAIPNVWAIDSNPERVQRLIDKGMNVFVADAEDSEFWQAINKQDIELIIIALPSNEASLTVVEQLNKASYTSKIMAVAQYADEKENLHEAGVHASFNIFQEAGAKLAEDSLKKLDSSQR